jgi:hypothetical protein
VEALQFYFFLNHILRKTERTPGESTGRTPSIFLKIIYPKAIILQGKKENNFHLII